MNPPRDETQPDLVNFGFLRYNVLRNGLRIVTLERKAVSDRNRRFKIYISSQEDGSHNLGDTSSRRWSEVDGVSLDVYFERREKSVGFAKMDVEGSEYRALMGMRQVIEESKKIDLITEFNPSALTRAGTDPTDYLKLLLKFDFQLSEIDEVRRRTIPLRESHFEELQSIPTLVNILCRRQKWEYTTIQVLYPFMA